MHKVGCVSFLNSKPLIDPVLERRDVEVEFAVPARLIDLVEAGTVSTALMSAVDYQNAQTDVLLLPAGMIGCDGPTLTVRIFSRVAPEDIQVVHGDTDSHTSVILAQVILKARYGLSVSMVPFPNAAEQGRTAGLETMLLIGDKVVTAAPEAEAYPYQLDLGEEWKVLTGLPFVFAMWMIRKDRAVGEGAALGRILREARERGAGITEELLDRYAEEKRWPRALARKYFTEYLRYEVTPRAREGLGRFFEMAQCQGLLPRRRGIEYLEISG
jgi:chorismate dehydratase